MQHQGFLGHFKNQYLQTLKLSDINAACLFLCTTLPIEQKEME